VADIRVAVIGAGLGGLATAQGLVRAGYDVTVYERDPDPDSRRQGYRLHVDARAGTALAECLPERLVRAFLATCGRPSTRVTVMTKQMRVLRTVAAPDRDPDDLSRLSTSVNRKTLRDVLASGLDQRIHYGSAVVGFDAGGDVIRLRFADGRSACADIVIGADGVHSAVRSQLLPAASVTESGTRIIYGKTVLRGPEPDLLPEPMRHGFTAIIDGRVGMAAGPVQFRTPPADVGLSPADDYLMWALTADADRFPVPLDGLDAAGLHGVVRRMTAAWHPDLRRLIDSADVDETFRIVVRTSRPIPPWPPGPVTLLGDAIHAMSPARGSGANTALQDAALLVRELRGAARDRPGLIQAIGRYEDRMRDYGFAAVAAAEEAERGMGMGPVAAAVQGVLDRLSRRR
jgi:2-polyprenyl-6-methoxyphenol hydroxylase-like FAD-dependent oxidoreductase